MNAITGHATASARRQRTTTWWRITPGPSFPLKLLFSLAAILLPLIPATGWTQTPAPEMVAGLKVYGPGGPQGPMQECTKVFSKHEHAPVQVIFGPEGKWIEQV